MLYTENFSDRILFQPIQEGADQLKIISGYAMPTMASWHIKEIAEPIRNLPPIDITLIVGMAKFDGILQTAHEGFKGIMARNGTRNQSNFTCQYVCEGAPIHSKLYLWERGGIPFRAFIGSANYTQTAFSRFRRELLHDCNPIEALNYFNSVEAQTIYCNHAEVEEYITLTRRHPVLETEELTPHTLVGAGVESLTLSFLDETGNVPARSGLNWGQRPHRNPNQAYISLPAMYARSGFFPLDGNTRGMNNPHFSVLTDDGVNLILRVEQLGNKAITTPLSNAQIGEYFRNRLGLANGAFVSREDLENYGRTDVTFYKLDEEQYYMDFSV